MRHLVRDLAGEGRTVFISSHLMSEMEQTADHVLVIGRGKLLADASITEILAEAGVHAIRVRSVDRDALAVILSRLATDVERLDDGALLVTGLSSAEIGAAAREANLELHELAEVHSSLEHAYLELTGSSVEHEASATEPEVKA